MSIFKDCDIRGIYPEQLTKEIALNLGRVIGTRYSGQQVLLGGDVRVSTPVLMECVEEGLRETGCHVIDLGILPTPAFNFSIKKLNAHAGVLVTASHNPREYNGFKLTLGRWPMNPLTLKELEKDIESKNYKKCRGGTVIEKSTITDYENFINKYSMKLKQQIPDAFEIYHRENDRRVVVVDCGNGCYSKIAPRVFLHSSYNVHELFCEEDGTFPNRDPNPAIRRNLIPLCKEVKEKRADIGIAFDGDGDRVIFVDKYGRMIDNDGLIAILARFFLHNRKDSKIIYDTKCSKLVPSEINQYGGLPVMEKSGHSYIKRTMMEEKAIFGGELSGHYFFGDLGWDDGLLAGLLISEILCTTTEELFDDLPRYVTTPDIRIQYHGNDKEDLLDQLASKLMRNSDCTVSRLDGVRCEFDDGWALVRISVTEPILTFRFESNSLKSLGRIKDRFLESVPKLKHLVDGVWDRYQSEFTTR